MHDSKLHQDPVDDLKAGLAGRATTGFATPYEQLVFLEVHQHELAYEFYRRMGALSRFNEMVEERIGILIKQVADIKRFTKGLDEDIECPSCSRMHRLGKCNG